MHECAYHGAVTYEWDPAKARANLSKHGVDFADAAIALEDNQALTTEIPSPRTRSAGSRQEGTPSAVCWWWFTRGAKKVSGQSPLGSPRHARSGSTRKAYETRI